MACLVAAWSVHNPTVTNSIIMVSIPPRSHFLSAHPSGQVMMPGPVASGRT